MFVTLPGLKSQINQSIATKTHAAGSWPCINMWWFKTVVCHWPTSLCLKNKKINNFMLKMPCKELGERQRKMVKYFRSTGHSKIPRSADLMVKGEGFRLGYKRDYDQIFGHSKVLVLFCVSWFGVSVSFGAFVFFSLTPMFCFSYFTAVSGAVCFGLFYVGPDFYDVLLVKPQFFI